jgi:hypothetical protein
VRRAAIGGPPAGSKTDPLLDWLIGAVLELQTASFEETADQMAADVSAGYQPLDATLTAIAAFNTNGFLVQVAADTFAGRTLAAPAAGLTITNPAGTAGNPTFALANDLSALEGLGATGIAVRSAADTWVQRSIAGTANEITATNGDGVAGNPTLSLPAALTFTGKTVTGGTFNITDGSWSSTWSSSQTNNAQITPLSIRNLSNGASAQTRFSIGNDSDANDFAFNLFSSGAGSSRQCEIKANAGNLVLTVAGTLGAPTVNTNTTASAANVNVDGSGLLKRSTSSRRYKRKIKDYVRGLADLMRLRPVRYEARKGDGTVYAGLIAEEVHAAGLTEFVVYDKKGRPDALHYPHMVALLVNAVKDLSDQVETLKREMQR